MSEATANKNKEGLGYSGMGIFNRINCIYRNLDLCTRYLGLIIRFNFWLDTRLNRRIYSGSILADYSFGSNWDSDIDLPVLKK